MAETGRTLIETCLTMGIFALVSAISTPQFRDMKRNLEVKNSALIVEEHILQLPTLARLNQSDLSVRVIGNSLITTTRQQPQRQLRVIHLPKTISARIATGDQRIAAYTSNTLSPGRVLLFSQTHECSLTISLRGRVRLNCWMK